MGYIHPAKVSGHWEIAEVEQCPLFSGDVAMSKELAFVLINPYTIAKSRTGGVIARFIGRTNLELAGARMFGPSKELATAYADMVRGADSANAHTCGLIADYITEHYIPDPATGRPHRVMMLLFEGENAVEQIWRVTGSATLREDCGETIRDTYGDYVLDEENNVRYFEPAVLVAPSKSRAAATLGLWSRYSSSDGGIIDSAKDVPHGNQIEKTLVLIKPDNFRFPSSKPGNIIDILSMSGLRIVAVRKICMTVKQAEEFYGPVRETLADKFGDIGGARAARALGKEFGFTIPVEAMDSVCKQLGPVFAETQFEEIVKFMTGRRPSECSEFEKCRPGEEACLALVYEGADAVAKIRSILGTTDPNKAKPGSVRREFGTDVMVNAAHASDSPERALEEIAILRIEQDSVKPLLDAYYGGPLSKVSALRDLVPEAGCRFLKKVRERWETARSSTRGLER